MRDVLAYSDYIIAFNNQGIPLAQAVMHSANAVHLDSLGSGVYESSSSNLYIENPRKRENHSFMSP